MPQLRAEVIRMLHDELIGPAGHSPASQTGFHLGDTPKEEILRAEDPPRIRYGAGVLFPGGAVVETQDDLLTEEVPDERIGQSDLAEAEQNGFESILSERKGRIDSSEVSASTDLEVNRANEYLPSALGVSALIQIPEKLLVRVDAATYLKIPGHAGRGWRRRDGGVTGDHLWFRRPISAELEFTQSELMAEPFAIIERTIGDTEDLRLHVFSRRSRVGNHASNERIITWTLINRKVSSGARARDEDCYYQCSLKIQGGNAEDCIREYPAIAPRPDDNPEELSLRLLYRHRRVFGVGHGCAADWPETKTDAVKWLRSESMPSYEIKPIVADDFVDLELGMHRLSESEGMYAAGIAHTLAEKYRAWIDHQKTTLDEEEAGGKLGKPLVAAARNHLDDCRRCLSRIEDGAGLLKSNIPVRRAFALMNRAMLMQQIHYGISSRQTRKWEKSSSHGAPLAPERAFESPNYEDESRRWRPFQLAFILMNLRSMFDPDNAEASIVDVIWFPTGGGKTEAYFGLAAFTILLGRMQNSTDAGTTVLMRYTLRLLTTQQFQRASSLICALEKIRRESSMELGTIPISIGLWVGGSVTPNKESDAIEKLHKLQNGDNINPFILRSCPWCGIEMGPVTHGSKIRVKGYRELTVPKRMRFVCEDDACEFNSGEGLPVRIIDEHLYSEPPTLLIGTVDKFALIPWIPECRSLFGIGRPGISPPRLIIQDELHLISGPLGSMVGHYETLVDTLCKRENGGAAKIVASTATIARAKEQIHAIYARKYSQLFPPQALKAGDSFFAREDETRAGRVYVGVFASALPSQVTTQIRTLSVLLQAPLSLAHNNPAHLDRYWTLMVYFNSIRELGHAATLVRADIVEYMSAMWERLGLSNNFRATGQQDKRRFLNLDLELTSRVSSSEVTDVMNSLFVPTGREDARAVDICLATNMVQVGLDVPRLNLMAIVGQPKTASEYIQASSRVGRESPGLVVTILNPGKPRDRSHLEHFKSFHQSIYRYVEPTSVTPFAMPVRERALHAVIVALARMWGSEQVRRRPDPPPPSALFDRIREVIRTRVTEVDQAECDNTIARVDAFVAEWERLAPSIYGAFGPPPVDTPLMFPAGSQKLPEWDDRAWATPSSMRNVDATCNALGIASYPGG